MENINRYLCKAKRKSDGEWVWGYLIRNDKGYLSIFDLVLEHIEEVNPDTICQCTGFSDMNDNWIFENDILATNGRMDYNGISPPWYQRVIWDSQNGRFLMYDSKGNGFIPELNNWYSISQYSCNRCKIVGNSLDYEIKIMKHEDN